MSKKEKEVTLSVRLPESEKDKFLEWLDQNSVGVSQSEQFRQFIYRVNAGEVAFKKSAVSQIQKQRLQTSTILIERGGWTYDKDLQRVVKRKVGLRLR